MAYHGIEMSRCEIGCMIETLDAVFLEGLFGGLRDVVSWACSVRRVENESGPKTFAADGHALAT